MYYNESGQEFHVRALGADGKFASGIASSLSCKLRLDDGVLDFLIQNVAYEIGNTGEYIFDLTQSETRAYVQYFSPTSNIADVQVYGIPANVIRPSLEKQIISSIENIPQTSGETTKSIYTTIDSLETVTIVCDKEVQGDTVTVTVQEKRAYDWVEVDVIDDAAIAKLGNVISFRLTEPMTETANDKRLLVTRASDGDTVASPYLFVQELVARAV